MDWLRKVGEARNREELVEMVREYLAAWYHKDLAEIAEECRPTRIRFAEDIPYWSERLAEGFFERTAHAEMPARHREMLTFFVEAARRVEALSAREPGGESAQSPARVG